MVVRRNDRRRRLMSEDYVSTFAGDGDGDSNVADDHSSTPTIEETKKRTYALENDSRGQLKTTDLFPKRLWVIGLCGLMLVGIVIGLNTLNFYAPAWRPLIGDAAFQAISLKGPGTLVSWMMSMTLLLTGLSSLQIFALRRHRCDDYGGTYRVWLLVPPIFFIGSIAAIVDFGSIIGHLTSLTQTTWLSNDSLIPMTFKLSLLALVILRILFEVRDSKSAFATLVIAWLATAVSTVLDTSWAAARIASQDLAMVYPNAVLIATIAFLLSHLFYVRFVYLHAHGVIKPKQKLKTTKQPKSKLKRQRRSKPNKNTNTNTTDKTGSIVGGDTISNGQPMAHVSDGSAASANQTATPTHQGKRTKKIKNTAATSGQKASSKTRPAQAASNMATAEQPAQRTKPPIAAAMSETKNAASSSTSSATSSPASSKKKTNTMSDFQALLKKKQAQQQAQQQTAEATGDTGKDDFPADQVLTGKMTKAQRRRARKAAKNNRKAA